MNSLEPGTVLVERYHIVRTLRGGGMGVLYEARDGRLADSSCVVKQLLVENRQDDEAELLRRKFEEEMHFLSTLSHPAIPRVRDAFMSDGKHFLVMDMVDGETLQEELERVAAEGGALPAAQVVDDAIQVLDVLVYLHRQSPPVIHRDVKPANIMRERASGRVKLLDFGIARLHDAGPATHTRLGTLVYAPLEQIQGHAEPRSDLYALGATMHHLLSGRESPALGIPPLQRLAPQVDPELCAIVNRAVAFSPIDRYEDAERMRAALVEWRDAQVRAADTQSPSQGDGVDAAQPIVAKGEPTRPVSDRSDRPVSVSRVCAAGLVLLAILMASWWELRPSTQADTVSQGNAASHRHVFQEAKPIGMNSDSAAETTLATPSSTPGPGGQRIRYAKPMLRAERDAAENARAIRTAARDVPVDRRQASEAIPAGGSDVDGSPSIAYAAARENDASARQTRRVDPSESESPSQGGPPAEPTPPPDRGAPPDRGGPSAQGPLGQRPAGQQPPPGMADPRAVFQSWQPVVSPGWSVSKSQMTPNPPRREITLADGAGSSVRVILQDMPTGLFDDITDRLKQDVAAQGWQLGDARKDYDGEVEVYAMRRGNEQGELWIRCQSLDNVNARLVALIIQSDSAQDLLAARGVARNNIDPH